MDTESQFSRRKKKPRGKLDLFKCSFCRKDKQKCEPQTRVWPEKCHRCEHKGFDCSPSTRKRATRRGVNPAPVPGGIAIAHPPSPPSPVTPIHHIDVDTSADAGAETQLPAATWNLTQLADAVSLYKVYSRAAARSALWMIELEEIFPGFSGSEELESFNYSTSHFSRRLCDAITARVAALSTRSDLHAKLEKTILRKSIFEVTDLPAGRDRDYEDCDSKIAAASNVILDMRAENEFGPASLLQETLLAWTGPGAVSESPGSNEMVYFELCDAFRKSVANLPLELTGSFRRHKSMLINPFIFDRIDFVSPLLHLEKGNWNRRDCLGSSVLHVVLEQLSRRDHTVGYYSLGSVGRSRLVEAITNYYEEAFDNPDGIGRSAIHLATQYRLIDVVTAFLRASFDPNEETLTGCTPLHYAAAIGEEVICRELLAYNANINHRDMYCRTPLDYAARKGHTGVTRLFLENPRTKVNIKTLSGNTALMSALRWGSEGSHQPFLIHPDVNFNVENDMSETALHLAVDKMSVAVVEELLPKCANSINRQDAQGRTPLAIAAASRREQASDVLRALLRVNSIDASLTDADGKTPLHHAAIVGNMDTCRLLGFRVDSGIFTMCKVKNRTPFDYAAHHGHLQVAALLLEIQTRVSSLNAVLAYGLPS